jgi:hypothetical protein
MKLLVGNDIRTTIQFYLFLNTAFENVDESHQLIKSDATVLGYPRALGLAGLALTVIIQFFGCLPWSLGPAPQNTPFPA